MKIIWTEEAWQDYLYWQGQDRKTLKRINKLIDDIARNGNMHGTGKPEPLQYDLQGFFSRRIDDTNRLVYVASDTSVSIISCRYHY